MISVVIIKKKTYSSPFRKTTAFEKSFAQADGTYAKTQRAGCLTTDRQLSVKLRFDENCSNSLPPTSRGNEFQQLTCETSPSSGEFLCRQKSS